MGDIETAKARVLVEPRAVLTGGLLRAIMNPFPDAGSGWDRIDLVIICVGGLSLWVWWHSSRTITRDDCVHQEKTFREERAGRAFSFFFPGALFLRNARPPARQQPEEATRIGANDIVAAAEKDTATPARVGSVLLGLYWIALGGWFFMASDAPPARRHLAVDAWPVRWHIIVIGASFILGPLVVWWLPV